MKAQIKPRIETENRTRLETVIPLSTPYLVFLDPSDICNFQCKFCPTGKRELIRSVRKPQLMDWRLYQKIIDDLRDMPEPIKTLRLYSDGEPLLNNYLPEMIAYAKSRGRFLSIDTTTNASLLRPNVNRRLIGAGLNKIFISVNGLNEADYWSFCKYKIDFKRFVKNIRHFYNHRGNCKMTIKIAGDNLADGEAEKFYEIFGNICDNIFIEHTADCWPHFKVEGVNQEKGIYGQPIKEVQVCPYIFYSLAINSDGTVSLCFLDWQHNMIIGDLNKENFKNIWNGNTLRELQKIQLEGLRERYDYISDVKGTEKTISPCGQCGQLKYGNPDDIDQYADEILRRFK